MQVLHLILVNHACLLIFWPGLVQAGTKVLLFWFRLGFLNFSVAFLWIIGHSLLIPATWYGLGQAEENQTAQHWPDQHYSNVSCSSVSSKWRYWLISLFKVRLTSETANKNVTAVQLCCDWFLSEYFHHKKFIRQKWKPQLQHLIKRV